MQQIILNLSDYTMLHPDNQIKEFVSMQEALRHVKNRLVKKILLTGASVVHEELPVIYGDHTQLEILLEKVLDNTLKFSNSNVRPEIRIGAEERENHWEFSIRDNGIGFDPAFHDRMFMLFQRLHPRNRFSGAGIGLAFCKRIAENHNRTMWATLAPEAGSIFYFTIRKFSGEG